MATTAALVFQGHDRLTYLLTADETGGTLTIANATLQTDALAGPIRSIARAKNDGIGTIAPGTVLTQDQARALLLADSSGANVGNKNVPRTICKIVGRDVGDDVWVDANVDVGGNPTIEATVVADAHAYLDIIFVGGIGTT